MHDDSLVAYHRTVTLHRAGSSNYLLSNTQNVRYLIILTKSQPLLELPQLSSTPPFYKAEVNGNIMNADL